jgi:hypothetical protein
VTLTPKYKLSGVAAKCSMLLLVVISSVAAISFNSVSLLGKGFVISKLDVCLEARIPSQSLPNSPRNWEAKTPSDPQQTIKQSDFIKKTNLWSLRKLPNTNLIDLIPLLQESQEAAGGLVYLNSYST